MVCGFAPSSCSTTAVRPARFTTVTVTLYPSLRHCSKAPIATSCAALNDRVRSVTSAGGVAAVCAWATGDTMARAAAKTSHLLLVMRSSFVVCNLRTAGVSGRCRHQYRGTAYQHTAFWHALPLAHGCWRRWRHAALADMPFLSYNAGYVCMLNGTMRCGSPLTAGVR